TGGGTPVQPASQAVFKAHQGPIIFLDANDATIQKRLEADGIASRPLFQQLGMDGLLKLKRSRQATYEDLATTVIHVDEKDPATIAQEIIDQLTS
ncbi:shikimate kinase, partial [Fructobacillus ficulneus]